MTIASLNQLEREKFLDLLGGIYEHSAWVALEALEKRPFERPSQLAKVFRSIVDASTAEQKRTLLLAHPDLAGKLAVEDKLTAESRNEQAGLGLDRLPQATFERLSALNEAYRSKFGIPFIVCVRLVADVDELLAIFERRLELSPEEEFETALQEVHKIAELRLADLF
ncbi:2-oxo-4-hydroxy-4-carboxy-5-ureidoimidazoline decarboxylase [Roseibacillus persicicus]|uniref:2-oxo-4-hydroxy-4-carboxy-5-ureidoimidazoline decarboxylase n=1 Tax=Roseibacillus persicicus TaxID=454148 RepID=A0A918WIB4_9BACT|nr:2-oxo-4-hydroxy-4-carboxy-5-ureidoimidazoline decarboxylase [Roseibacillus persicicus]GHC50168.1 OHCU decarboxylase [Roseibacillus persicicus]